MGGVLQVRRQAPHEVRCPLSDPDRQTDYWRTLADYPIHVTPIVSCPNTASSLLLPLRTSKRAGVNLL